MPQALLKEPGQPNQPSTVEELPALAQLRESELQNFDICRENNCAILTFSSTEGRYGLAWRRRNGDQMLASISDVKQERLTSMSGDGYATEIEHLPDGTVNYRITLREDMFSARVVLGQKNFGICVDDLLRQKEEASQRVVEAALPPAIAAPPIFAPPIVTPPIVSPAIVIPAAATPLPILPAARESGAEPKPSVAVAEPTGVEPQPVVTVAQPVNVEPDAPVELTPQQDPPPFEAEETAASDGVTALPSAAEPSTATVVQGDQTPASETRPAVEGPAAARPALPPASGEVLSIVARLGLRWNEPGDTFHRQGYRGQYTLFEGEHGPIVHYREGATQRELRSGSDQWVDVRASNSGTLIHPGQLFAAVRTQAVASEVIEQTVELTKKLRLVPSGADYFIADSSHCRDHPGNYSIVCDRRTNEVKAVYADSARCQTWDGKQWLDAVPSGPEVQLISARTVNSSVSPLTFLTSSERSALELIRRLGLVLEQDGSYSRPGKQGRYELMRKNSGEIFAAYREGSTGSWSYEFHPGEGAWKTVAEDTWSNWLAGTSDRSLGTPLSGNKLQEYTRTVRLTEEQRTEAHRLLSAAGVEIEGEALLAAADHRKAHPNPYFLQIDPERGSLSLYYANGERGEQSQVRALAEDSWRPQAPQGLLVSPRCLTQGTSAIAAAPATP